MFLGIRVAINAFYKYHCIFFLWILCVILGTGSSSDVMASLCFPYDVEASRKIFGESLPSTKFSFYRKGFLDLGEELMKKFTISVFIWNTNILVCWAGSQKTYEEII